MSTFVRRAAFSALVVSLVVVACSDAGEVVDASIDATSEAAGDATSEAAVDVTTDPTQDIADQAAPQDDATADVTTDDATDDAQGDASQDAADAAQDASIQDATQDVAADVAVDASSDAGGCVNNSTCGIGFYCEHGTGTCGAAGSCMVRPTFCPSIVAPVCGCDDVTYNNSCLAHRLGGITVAYAGSCE